MSTKPRALNALYALVAEFVVHNPRATASDAWDHFTALAGGSPLLPAYDAEGDRLAYLAGARDIIPRWVRRRSFDQAFFRVRAQSKASHLAMSAKVGNGSRD